MFVRLAAILTIVMVMAVLWMPGFAFAFSTDPRILSKTVTSTLDQLLNRSRYDKRIRPDFGGPPVVITVNMHIKSMGPVSETDQNYVMDCYFRQTWYDRRLVFNYSGSSEFSLSWLFLDRVWKPDTFFLNGKKSYLHRITVPNKFLRLRRDGFLTYSMRLTVKASCPMHLRKFPLDSQSCPLLIGSYGYRTNDVVYVWDHPKKVGVEPDVELSQYELVNITTEDFPKFMRGVDEYSMIKVEFHMRRNIGYFVLQLYVPCGLIVCCSWVSFWIDPDAVPARVSLGVTTVLSMTTMGFGGRAQMPRVSYATALDSFVIICFSFVFAVMIEYAAINFIDKVVEDFKKILQDRGVKRKSPPKASPDPIDPNLEPRSVSMINISTSSGHIYNEIDDTGEEKDKNCHLSATDTRERRKSLVTLAAPYIDSLKRNIERRKSEISLHLPQIPLLTQRRKSEASINRAPIPLITVTGNEEEFTEVQMASEDHAPSVDDVINIGSDEAFEEEEGEEVDDTETEDGTCLSIVVLTFVFLYKLVTKPWRIFRNTKCLPTEAQVQELIVSGETPKKFSKIDIAARKYFPVAFCILITSYWIAYMYYITDDFPEKDIHPLLKKSKCIG